MILTRAVDSTEIKIECDEALAAAAADVVRKFESLHRSGDVLRDGLRVRFGWSVLTLRAEDHALRVCEPAFDRNPLVELNSTVDVTLRVLVSQVGVLRRVGEAGSDISFEQLVLARGAELEAPSIFLQRLKPAGEQDSGWLIGDADRIESPERDDLRPIRIFELLRRRPEALQALALPVGYVVVMRGGEIAQVYDAGGRELWSEKL